MNVASGRPVALRDLIGIAMRELHGEGLVKFGAWAGRDEPPLIVGDTTRLANAVGWQPAHSVEEGLRMNIEWCRSRLLHRRLTVTGTASV